MTLFRPIRLGVIAVIVLMARLKSRGYTGLVLGGGLLEDETHRTIFPNAVTKGLRFVFNDRKPS